jgi:hypothetical protein
MNEGFGPTVARVVFDGLSAHPVAQDA